MGVAALALEFGADEDQAIAALLHDAVDYRNQGEALWERFGGGREGTLWYYREVTRIIPVSVSASLGLRRAMADLESLLEPVPAGI